MANADITLFCVEPTIVSPDCISFPGGVELCAQAGFETGDQLASTKSLFGNAGAVLAPLAPGLTVLDVTLQTFKCIQSIPDCFKTLSPIPLLKCLPELVEKANKLLQLIPQLSLPLTIRGMLKTIISFLKALKAKLQAMINRQLQIAAGRERATLLDNTQLTIALDCAQAALDAQLVNLNAGMGPINTLIGVVSAFMQIAGLGCIPPMGSIGAITGDVLSPIDVIIEILQAIYDAVPDLGSLPLSGGGDC
jgi:hypothetical protein